MSGTMSDFSRVMFYSHTTSLIILLTIHYSQALWIHKNFVLFVSIYFYMYIIL